ncbi:OmpH family outer membrane protein [Alloprevotella sp. OH1205_COT-284]|uniref:OmpH family outer membrane protein n=1 Tax=Alloprevotella sp. OH1205_COT-284 TaxID=2491043 RepID=UPI000F601B84|nr:OmpH family outer membrane protein [Alloprevotella sp. OH1205_COT-284]RRD80876.1 OmpH family outer membrane protein [Alloprevotella sp. OH1205_COT-284]
MFKKLMILVLMMAPLTILAQKFAHFDSGEILKIYPEAQAAQTALEALGKQYQADLEAMEKELQTKVQKFESEINESTPANMRQRRQQELQELQQRIRQAYQDNEQAFRQESQKKMQPIQEKVYAAIEAVLKEGGYVYGVDKAIVAGLSINSALSTDISAQIKAKLGIK